MKSILRTIQRSLLALSVIALTAAAACSDDPASPNQTENGSVAATVDGAAWSATNVQATWTSNVLGIGGAEINGATNRQINITGIINAPGTYQINPFAGINATYTEGSGASVSVYTSTSGTLTVTELDDEGAKGTFSFDAQNSQTSARKSVTSGTFDITF